jgi:hypothetical protein
MLLVELFYGWDYVIIGIMLLVVLFHEWNYFYQWNYVTSWTNNSFYQAFSDAALLLFLPALKPLNSSAYSKIRKGS